MANSLPDFHMEIDQVNAYIADSVETDCELLREASDYVQVSQGKRLRARLVLLTAQALGSLDDRAVRASVSVELVHLASLIHDDVIDKAPLRRGKPSVNARFGDDVAILLADYFYSLAFDFALSTMEPEATRVITRATRDMSESELRQIEMRDRIVPEKDYLRVIRTKTAGLISACTELGTVPAGLPPEKRKVFADFGLQLGMAYQITDDALDYSAQSEHWGKQVGNDLEQGKLTLPVVFAFGQASEGDREILTDQLRNGRNMRKVLGVVEKYRGLDYARRRAREFADQADRLIANMAVDEYADVFRDICRFVVERPY